MGEGWNRIKKVRNGKRMKMNKRKNSPLEGKSVLLQTIFPHSGAGVTTAS